MSKTKILQYLEESIDRAGTFTVVDSFESASHVRTNAGIQEIDDDFEPDDYEDATDVTQNIEPPEKTVQINSYVKVNNAPSPLPLPTMAESGEVPPLMMNDGKPDTPIANAAGVEPLPIPVWDDK